MAFSAITARGNATAQTGATSIAMSPSANLTVGKLVVVTVHVDNTATADGDSSTITSVTDNASGSQNVWNKATERTETDGAANDGSVVAVWYCIVATQIATTDTITANLSASITARAITCTEATIATDNVSVRDVGVGQNSITAASAVIESREYLFFYAASSEGNDTTKTVTANYAEQHDFRTGNTGDVNISGYVQTRIQTATSSGSVAPGSWTTNLTNPISVLVSFFESDAVAPGVGSVGLTGLTGSLALALGLTAGSLGLTGPYIGVAFEGPTVGSVDLTGLAPTVSVAESGTTASPPAGTIDLTGRAPSLAFTYAVPVGSLDLTGRAPTSSENVFAFPGVGSVDLTGLAPALLSNLDRAPGVGSLDLTGLAPALAFVHPVPVGAIDLTGAAPSLQVTTLMAPGAGSIDLTGLAPSLAFVYSIPVGAIDLTGLTPGVFSGALITTGVGTLDLTGLAPTLAFSAAIPVGTLDLTGLAPSALVNATVAPGVGTIDLAGLAPALAFGLSIPAGTVDLTGLAPSLGGQSVVNPGVGTIDLTGLAPNSTVNTFASPGAGTIDLTGNTPSLALVIPIPVGSIGLTGLAPGVDSTGDPIIVEITGIYSPTVTVTGSYSPTVAITGIYSPVITITGQSEAE